MGPGPTRAADENVTSVDSSLLILSHGCFFIVKKSDDECCFDSLSVRMQRFTRENIDKHGRITGKCCRHKLSKTEVKLMKQKDLQDSAKTCGSWKAVRPGGDCL